MDVSDLQELFGEAKRLTGHSEFVVVGSLSILGVLPAREIPARMLLSIDVDCYTRREPARVFELQEPLGQGSAFERTHGFYLDPISPDVPTLPENWEYRLLRVPLANGLVLFFLDPNDAAVSKYARGEPRDQEWIHAGLKAGLLSIPIIESRCRETVFIDAPERDRALSALAEDRRRFNRRAPG